MAELFTALNGWAVLVSTLVYFILGGLWYSVLFTNKWMELRGITQEDIEKQGGPNPVIFLWTFLLQLVAVTTLALVIQAIGVNVAGTGLLIGLGIGLGIVFTLTANTALFADTRPALHFIDNGYHVIALGLAGIILGAW